MAGRGRTSKAKASSKSKRKAVPDGGRAALAGFLYQLVGTLGLATWISDCVPPSADDGQLDALIQLPNDAILTPEQLNQDLAIQLGLNGSRGIILVQFKYSGFPGRAPIHRNELLKISETLHESARRAENRGDRVVGYKLISNRRLAKTAQALIPANRTRRRSVQAPDSILSNLGVIKYSFANWIDELHAFARRYGTLQGEIDEGISRLLGDVFLGSSNQRPIRLCNLVKAFTGYQEAKPLTVDAVSKRSRECIERFARDYAIPLPIRRKVLTEIREKSRQGALVVLSGLGGNGKTVALSQWASSLLAPPDLHGALTHVDYASDIDDGWISRVASDWADLPPGHERRKNETPGQTIERLGVANPNLERPVVHLGLDGVDDDLRDRSAVREICRWFWRCNPSTTSGNAPPATLVITCRDVKTVEQMLNLNRSGMGLGGTSLPAVEVTEFSNEELLEAAIEADLREPIVGKLQRTVLALDQEFPNSGSGIPISLNEAAPQDALAAPQIVRSLRHPAMWGSFACLPNNLRADVLRGQPDALRQLAQKFVNWFITKASQRQLGRSLGNQEIEAVLCDVARHCNGQGVADYTRQDWEKAACGRRIVNQIQAGILLSEAHSAGLTQGGREPGRWRWYHGFVAEYLVELQ